MKKPRAFTLRLGISLHAACEHYAAAEGVSLQRWIQKRLEAVVGTDALTVAAYAELSGRKPLSWPALLK